MQILQLPLAHDIPTKILDKSLSEGDKMQLSDITYQVLNKSATSEAIGSNLEMYWYWSQQAETIQANLVAW